MAKYSKRVSRENLKKFADLAWSAFLILTYIVFASVSTTVFDTFNCSKIGDDPHVWLARDHSIDCKSPLHIKYKTYATVMVFVYPLGIPALYATVLFRSRTRLMSVDRDFDPTIQKLGFLWQNYEVDKWWFELFECGRRLGMSGVLVFVAQGTASQIVVGMLISVITTGLYIHWRPFEQESDDDLAIVTQVSLFFTLLAALLKKVEVDKTDQYNEQVFGYMLIVVNCSSIALIILSQFSKPIHFWVDAVIGRRHSHEGVLRGMNKEQKKGRDGLIQHFLRVAKSSVDEAGWESYTRRSEKWIDFLEYSGATVERRCSTGNGPIDETRAVFVIDCCDFKKVKNWVLNKEKDLRHGVIECHDVVRESKSARPPEKIEYMARKMKGIFSNRDYLVEHFEGTAEDGGWYSVKRSIADIKLYSLKRSYSAKRVRAEVLYQGWLVHDLGEGEGARVTYLENVDPGGILKGLIVNKTLPKLLRDTIDDLLAHLEEEGVDKAFRMFDDGEGEEEGLEIKMVTKKMVQEGGGIEGGLVLGGCWGPGGRGPKNPLLLNKTTANPKLNVRVNSKGLLDVGKGKGKGKAKGAPFFDSTAKPNFHNSTATCTHIHNPTASHVLSSTATNKPTISSPRTASAGAH
ncbi:hypothetical protein TL16_g02375 [Triparma laevis f. inornata]|uniref:START domain-containing protein n=1 Tax=Triparma laevis f. inornata TaxID=1714386 RepID=A0A9W6ZUL6_9STRA|nr:hypothetical protein TL16_g02375 [Triparma laevis f. inornata]